MGLTKYEVRVNNAALLLLESDSSRIIQNYYTVIRIKSSMSRYENTERQRENCGKQHANRRDKEQSKNEQDK
jgi:hypothetical protein